MENIEAETCPECGEPYLYAEDWGRAGALFVHSFATEAGMRHKIACHVTKRKLPGLEDSDKETRPWRHGRFGTDATPGPYEGFTCGDLWNGWATPVFEREQAQRIADDFAHLHSRWGEFVGRYDNDKDAFIFIDPGAGEEEIYKASEIIVDGVQRTVFAIGTCYWTWEELNQDT